MKKSLLLAGLLFAISLTVSAQQKKSTVFLHKIATMNEIGLNEEQQAKITNLTQQSFKDIAKIRKNTDLSDSEKKSAISKVYRKRQKDYEAALTAEQLKKYNDLKEAAKNQ
ncbi:hypothetical protein G5B30_15425 [Sphingobacterium sp. SGG-5]|uniref:hypothetical protein n=1 Tax=Sphingobacterium sp. SGG-5 TaxID=2710881 RepID=UPI0013EC6B7B|nr:hypothetical protein [Sphingobacterium sp. SGG-5]NGM63299.1 hypothetical protein [Sphingobacterium sp. SGG-5]